MVLQRFCVAAALLLALAGGVRSEEPTEHESLPQAIYTRQGRFAIPFRVETPAANVPAPAKIRLFVSENGGRNWHLDAEVSPTEKNFDFRTAHDGEYWFTIRSVDAQGRSYPDGAYDPQLRVIVDTLAPRLDLRAERGPNGEVIAHWDALDAAIDPGKFQLEYQFAGGPWQAVAVDPESQHVARMTLVGETQWWPPAGSGKIALRATVFDRADNPAVSQFQLDLAEPPVAQGAPQAAVQGAAAAPPTTSAAGNTAAAGGAASGASANPRKLLEWPAESTGETLGRGVPGGATTVGRKFASDADWRAAKGNAGDRGSRGPGDARLSTVSQETAAGGQFGAWPVGDRPQMVNGRSFELDYEVN
ncbi:MAG TPA: hypothetical protein VMF30_19805, partial [Pirellulales bacterium]|nr:hypothetical protein [Pirellulales bacterium]